MLLTPYKSQDTKTFTPHELEHVWHSKQGCCVSWPNVFKAVSYTLNCTENTGRCWEFGMELRRESWEWSYSLKNDSGGEGLSGCSHTGLSWHVGLSLLWLMCLIWYMIDVLPVIGMANLLSAAAGWSCSRDNCSWVTTLCIHSGPISSSSANTRESFEKLIRCYDLFKAAAPDVWCVFRQQCVNRAGFFLAPHTGFYVGERKWVSAPACIERLCIHENKGVRTVCSAPCERDDVQLSGTSRTHPHTYTYTQTRCMLVSTNTHTDTQTQRLSDKQ